MSEICSFCGRSVRPGSGLFANRIPDVSRETRLHEGRQCFAWDGIQDDNQMLYPGIRRSEVITSP